MSSRSEPPILELRDIGFSYGRKGYTFADLSFSVGEGEFIGLLGANGSGKSTLLKLCSGILQPTAGGVMLWGRNLTSYRNRDRAKLISYLPQTLDIGAPFTVRELVDMGLYPYDTPPSITSDEALDMVGLLEKADEHISDLSGGEKRRAFIAMTLLQGAGLLLLDEPLANLDIKYQIELLKLLGKIREEKDVSVVMALHDINIALQFEKVLLIKDGRPLGFGKPDEILTGRGIVEAFGVSVRIVRHDDGKTYVRYEED